MSGISPDNGSKPPKINLKEVIEQSEWKNDPLVFEQRASLAIAQWVLILFASVYVLAFSATFLLLWRTDATFEKGADLIKFMIQSLLPLVTLAVGYYLGDKNPLNKQRDENGDLPSGRGAQSVFLRCLSPRNAQSPRWSANAL
jgi:hypothetical protein